MTERVNVAKLFSGLYLPETTFAGTALKINDRTAALDHTLTLAQCAPGKTAMLRGAISAEGNVATNRRKVNGELVLGHFIDFALLAGHQGFGILLAAGTYDNPMWWTAVESVSFQSPAALEDEMIATATITRNDESARLVSGKVMRAGATHTRANDIRLEAAQAGDFEGPYLPQNAWLEVAAQFGGGALVALGEFPGDDFAPMYLGVGESTLPKELGRPGDKLQGIVTLQSIEDLELPALGKIRVASVDIVISRGDPGKWNFTEVEFGFALRERLMEAVRQR